MFKKIKSISRLVPIMAACILGLSAASISNAQSVVVGGMLVNPGDLVCGDRDGLVAIPPHLVRDVAQLAKEKKHAEEAKRISYANTGK